MALQRSPFTGMVVGHYVQGFYTEMQKIIAQGSFCTWIGKIRLEVLSIQARTISLATAESLGLAKDTSGKTQARQELIAILHRNSAKSQMVAPAKTFMFSPERI